MSRGSIMATVIALSLVALAGESQADQTSIQFKASDQHTCWEDTAGFDANLQPNPLPANPPPGSINFIRQTHGADFSVLTFNADGTFTSQGTTSTIRSNTSFGESTFSCSGTFAVQPNLSVTTNPACTFQNTVPSGDHGTITGGASLLQVTQGIELLMLSSLHPPVIETVNVTVPDGTPFTFQRLCTRAGSASHLNP